MSRTNAFMEWLDQTKKLSKAVDYMALDLIDDVMDNLPYIDQKVIRDHKDFFNYYCVAYHKPSPTKALTKAPAKDCLPFREALSLFIEKSIKRAKKQREIVVWQWFEVIDFMYERPEFVNPSTGNDDYIRDQINTVCAEHRKNNPLTNGIVSRFGKYWKGPTGHWRPERRKRF